ncbi:MAG: molybdenum ABC transporter ATP-binding protein [Mariprofundaceae bacterium]
MSDALRADLKLSYANFTLDVDFTMPDKGITALFGPSGCGKSSILRILAGLEKRASGHVFLGKQCWLDSAKGIWMPPHQRPVGMVFQDARLFPHLSVLDNLMYGRKRRKRGAHHYSLERIVEMLDIGGKLKRMPTALSGGERQRVAIGRALLSEPEVLLLDEPLAALDRARKHEILPFLQQMHHELDIPMLYVSHSQDEIIQLADTLICIEAGRVRASGPLDTLLTSLGQSVAGELATSVLHGSVVRVPDRYGLADVETPLGVMKIPLELGNLGMKLRIKVSAQDVSLCLQKPTDSSILNIFPVTIQEVVTLDHAHLMVRIHAGGTSLLSKVTRKSGVDLNLKTGLKLYAQIKASSTSQGKF